MKKLLLFLLITGSVYGQGVLSPPAVSYPKFNAAIQARPARDPFRIIGHNLNPFHTAITTTSSLTGRKLYRTNGAVSMLKMVLMGNIQAGNSFENGFGGTNQIIATGSIEYSGMLNQFSSGGSQTMLINQNAMPLETSAVGTYIPAGTNFYIRYFNRIALPPTSPAAALASGGSLTVSTAYYYFITTVDVNNIESGPTTAVSVTPTSGNQSATVTWTRNAYAQGYRIYRNTTNTASTAQFIGQVPDPVQTFTDAGVTAIAVNPAVASTVLLNSTMTANDYCNLASYGGTGADLTPPLVTAPSSSGFAQGSATTNLYSVSPALLLGDDTQTPSITGLGDSKMWGIGIAYQNTPTYNNLILNWFDASNTGSYASLNLGIPSVRLRDFLSVGTNNGISARLRLALTRYSDYVHISLGINDLSAGDSWTTIATNAINLANILYNRGIRVTISTITPYVTSTDMCLTVGNQTLGSTNSARINFNNWVRNGFRMSSGTPVLSGGTPSPYFYSYFDEANTLEVNSSNVATQDGGYMKAPAAAAITGQVITGTPTTTSITVGSASYTPSAYASYVLQMTSGSQNGKIALVSANTATTLTLLANGTAFNTGVTSAVGLTTAPAAGDTFSLWPVNVFDGLHFTSSGSAIIAASASTFFNALPIFAQ